MLRTCYAFAAFLSCSFCFADTHVTRSVSETPCCRVETVTKTRTLAKKCRVCRERKCECDHASKPAGTLTPTPVN